MCTQTGIGEDRSQADRALLAADDNVDIQGIQLHRVADAAGGLGGDQGRTRAEEGINHDVAPVGDVNPRVLKQDGRLDRRMIFEPSSGVGAKGRGSRISPDVRAPAPAFSEFDVVDMWGEPFLNRGRGCPCRRSSSRKR